MRTKSNLIVTIPTHVKAELESLCTGRLALTKLKELTVTLRRCERALGLKPDLNAWIVSRVHSVTLEAEQLVRKVVPPSSSGRYDARCTALSLMQALAEAQQAATALDRLGGALGFAVATWQHVRLIELPDQIRAALARLYPKEQTRHHMSANRWMAQRSVLLPVMRSIGIGSELKAMTSSLAAERRILACTEELVALARRPLGNQKIPNLAVLTQRRRDIREATESLARLCHVLNRSHASSVRG